VSENIASESYIADFSSRQKAGQDLDVTAPGAWTVGPYQTNQSNKMSLFFLSGTSMASPHVAGIVALMAQKKPTLTAAQAEYLLEKSAIDLDAGCATVNDTVPTQMC
jgi:subtilisin family serine protease